MPISFCRENFQISLVVYKSLKLHSHLYDYLSVESSNILPRKPSRKLYSKQRQVYFSNEQIDVTF